MKEKWKSILIEGKLYNRIRVKSLSCKECQSEKGQFHRLGCKLESSPCKVHEFLVECKCLIRKGEDV